MTVSVGSADAEINSLDDVESSMASIRAAMIADMAGRPAKEIAAMVELDPALLSRYLSPGSLTSPPARLVILWTRRVGDRLALALLGACGFSPRRDPLAVQESPLVPLVARVAGEVGHTLSACLEALQDGVIDTREQGVIHELSGVLLADVQAVHDATRCPR